MCRHIISESMVPTSEVGAHAQEAVHERFREAFERHFTVKRVPRNKMDAVHQHPLIDILLLRRRSAPLQYRCD